MTVREEKQHENTGNTTKKVLYQTHVAVPVLCISLRGDFTQTPLAVDSGVRDVGWRCDKLLNNKIFLVNNVVILNRLITFFNN